MPRHSSIDSPSRIRTPCGGTAPETALHDDGNGLEWDGSHFCERLLQRSAPPDDALPPGPDLTAEENLREVFPPTRLDALMARSPVSRILGRPKDAAYVAVLQSAKQALQSTAVGDGVHRKGAHRQGTPMFAAARQRCRDYLNKRAATVMAAAADGRMASGRFHSNLRRLQEVQLLEGCLAKTLRHTSTRLALPGADAPDFDGRLRALADDWSRTSAVVPAPGRPHVLLLCDADGQPGIAFRPTEDDASVLRERMAATLDDLLRSSVGLSLDLPRPVAHELASRGPGVLTAAPGPLPPALRIAYEALHRPGAGGAAQLQQAAREAMDGLAPAALQQIALTRLFTDNWQAGWDGLLVDVDGRCWHLDGAETFPEDDGIVWLLDEIQAGGARAALFSPPPVDRSSTAWDAPLDAALVAKVRDIDTDDLTWCLCMTALRPWPATGSVAPEADHEGAPRAAAISDALFRPIDAIDAVQTLIAEDPSLSLRQLLARYPEVLDWFRSRPTASRRLSGTNDQDE